MKRLDYYKYKILDTIGHSMIDFGFWLRDKAN